MQTATSAHLPLFKSSQAAERFLAKSGHLPTPLHSLESAAKSLGLARLQVKDESNVLGLKSFKARGAAWAIARICAEALNIEQAPQDLASSRNLAAGRDLLFVSATDGNHGAAVASIASRLGQKAVIFMPRGASQARIRAITATGNECLVTDCNYDETVLKARDFAKSRKAFLIQDTAWPGYEQIPVWIMQGYATIATEIMAEASSLPTHVFLQAGVGSFAAAMIQAFLNLAQAARVKPPVFISVEPENAACIYKSIAAADKKAHAVKGEMPTLMDGLACGMPSSLAWPILRDNLMAACSCPDWIASTGMEYLALPADQDPVILSGPSGAPGMGILRWLMTSDWAAELGLNDQAKVLLISTEGLTDSFFA